MVTLFFFHFIGVCTVKGCISVCASCYTVFYLVHYIGRLLYAFAASAAFPIAAISFC